MANPKIDLKGAAMKMAAHAAGAAAFTQLNNAKFFKDLTNDKATNLPKAGPMKGIITALIGYIGIPLIAEKMKLSGKGKKADFIQNVGEGLGMVGVMLAANAQFPPKEAGKGIFPQISGYEEDPISGLGMITQEDEYDNVSGYEENPVSGYDEDDVVS